MSMIEEQIERRRQRAQEEIVRISNQGTHPVFSTFEVTSVSGRTYRVQIRSLTELLNSCTCPDYRTNMVGTCKHIEGVLYYLRQAAGDEWQKLEAQKPPVTFIYLHYGEEITVRVTRPLPENPVVRALLKRFFDEEGILRGEPLETLPRLLEDIVALNAEQQAALIVDEEVRQHLDLLRDREATRRQKEWFLAQMKQGTRSLDVLRDTRLYPYQETGALHLAFGRRAMLADDMGLGKTVQAIAACTLLHQLGDVDSALVICPASLKHQWAREIKRFTDLPVTVIEGPSKKRRVLYSQPTFFTIVNYELVRRDLTIFERMHPDVIVLDEAQRIKNWRTKTADSVKRLRSRYAFVLTGTPLENRLDELYSVFQFIDQRVLGPLWMFNERYFQLELRPNKTYRVLGYKNLDELRARIAPYVLRRTREQVLKDLPERIDNNFFVEMTREQWDAYSEYQSILARLLVISQKRPLRPKEHDLLLKSLIKMRLICNALALHDPDLPPKERERTAPKIREFRHIMTDEIANNGHKAIVFSQWSRMLALTEPVLSRLDLGYVKLTGQVPTHKRGDLIARFFDDPDCRVFLSTDAGGVGLNLQAASLVVNLDLPWNPAVLEQRIARAHRHGQREAVNVINLIAQGTIEERILDSLAAKRNVFAGVFGGEESPAEISFRDTGQGLLKQLSEMMEVKEEVKPVIELTPVKEKEAERAPEVIELPPPKPTLRTFADMLVARFPGRIVLVRKAPQLPGAAGDHNVLVVVDKEPAALRPQMEQVLNELFAPTPPAPTLHLMEQESYRALVALTGGLIERPSPESEELYRAPAVAVTVPPKRAEEEKRRKQLHLAREGFETAARRLQLARVVLGGGFPEEMLRPVREALGWAFSAHLALHKEYKPGPKLPSARLVQAELVEGGHLPDELAARLARVRELTAPPAEESDDETAPPPSVQTGEMLIATVQELVELGQKVIAENIV
ncbi:MAG TPA: helicase Snf2 [Anaerolineae bacterium]|nr:helicase Snf2 [Anaerolineae bacterium]